MNKLKLSRLCAAVDIYYKKAQAPAVTRELLMTMLNAFTNELPAKKQQYADNDPKKAAYDEAIKTMKEAFTAAAKNDWNAVNNAVSYSIFKINKSGVYDKSFEEYAGNFMRNISEFRKQPAETKPADGGDQKYWDDKAKYQAGQTPTTAPGKAAPATKPTGIPYRKDVEIAQQQLANMGGFDLGNTGRYGNGVDGKLGNKTRQALNKFNPYINVEQAIKELNRAYAAGPVPAKQEPTEAIPVGGRVPRGRTGIV